MIPEFPKKKKQQQQKHASSIPLCRDASTRVHLLNGEKGNHISYELINYNGCPLTGQMAMTLTGAK